MTLTSITILLQGISICLLAIGNIKVLRAVQKLQSQS